MSVTSCDIHPEAINFLNEKFGVDVVLSNSIPEKLEISDKFDVIFALSFFSHMPKITFGRWLKRLSSFLKPGGYFIFTTHGLLSTAFLPDVEFDDDGFWFQPASEQEDINTSEYGLTCTQPKYVFSQIFESLELTIKCFQEGYWWGHQDLFVIKR